MKSITASNYLSRKGIDESIRTFGKGFSEEAKVIDIGCGDKPYARYFRCQYYGLDVANNSKADYVGDILNNQLSDATYDGIVMTQVLEHVEDAQKAIDEVERLLKPGGRAFISAPFCMRVHETPISSDIAKYNNFNKNIHPIWQRDYWRFSKYGLIVLCKNFTRVEINETTGYLCTILQMINYFFASFGVPYVFIPVYLFNNLIGRTLDVFADVFCKNSHWSVLQKFYNLIHKGLTLNYVVIAEK